MSTQNPFLSNGRICLLVLLIISAGLHAAYLFQLQQTPYATLLMVDAQGYHLKALKLLENGWMGDRIFFQAPLYPYFLAVIYKVFGVSFLAVQIIQLFISLTNIVLIYLLGKTLFDEKTGLLSAALSVFYGPFIFYSGLLLKITLSLFFSCLLLLALLRTLRKPTGWNYLAAGLLLGINITLRGNFFLMLPALVAWILFTPGSARLRSAGLFVLGTFIALAPVTARNYYLEKDFVPTTYDAGPSFYIGNHARATGYQVTVDGVRASPLFEEQDYRAVAEKKSGVKLTASAVSAFWFRQSLDFILNEPMAYLKLLAKKCFLFFNTFEIPDNYDFRFVKTLTPILQAGVVSYGVVMVCSILGIYLFRWNSPAFWLLYLYAGIYAVSVIMFYVVARFRMPVVPALIPLAAFFILEGWKKIPALRNFRLAGFAGILPVIASLAFWPFSISGTFAASHMNIGVYYEEQGLWKKALEHYKAIVKSDPGWELGHLRLGVAYRMLGNPDMALEELQEAIQLQPLLGNAHLEIGINYENKQMWEQAVDHYRTVLRLDPNSARAHLRLGVIYRVTGNMDVALSELQIAIKLDPNLADAHLETGLIHLTRGLLDESIAAYETGLKLQKTKTPEGYLNLGIAYYRKGQIDQAIREHQKAIELKPDLAEAHFNLGTFYSRKNDPVQSAYYHNKAAELRARNQ